MKLVPMGCMKIITPSSSTLWKNLRQAGTGEVDAVDVGGDLHPPQSQLVDAALELGDGDVDVLQRHRAHPDEAVGVLAHTSAMRSFTTRDVSRAAPAS